MTSVLEMAGHNSPILGLFLWRSITPRDDRNGVAEKVVKRRRAQVCSPHYMLHAVLVSSPLTYFGWRSPKTWLSCCEGYKDLTGFHLDPSR